jgi:hypothetical protein
MDSNTTTTPNPVNSGESTLNTIAKNRGIIPIAFALIIIFFFFSFCDFKCNNMKVASLSGINLVTGSHVKMTGSDMLNNDPFGTMNDNGINKSEDKNQKVKPNVWAIIAFLTAIGGVVVFYKKVKNEELLGTVGGAIGVISLLLLRSAIKNKLGEQSGGMVQIEIDFQFGYWASILAFIVAGGISYLRMKQGKLVVAKTVLPTPVETPVETKNTSTDSNTNTPGSEPLAQ